MSANLEGKIKIELGEVQKTLLLPLLGRARDYESRNSILKDKYAHDIVERLDYDFGDFLQRAPGQFMINCAVRAYHLDSALRETIARHPDTTVVNIGAGLDTAFQRVDNGRIYWYDLDLPDTIALRRKLIAEGERNRFIAKSVFDTTWFKDIELRGSKIFFIAAGVLVYLPEDQTRKVFEGMIREFPGSEIMFDIYSRKLMWLRNKTIASGRVKSELFVTHRWAVNSARKVARWNDRISIVDAFPYYSRIDLGKYWDAKDLAPLRLLNFFRMIKMVHLRLGYHENQF